jgi:acetyl esterase
MALDEATAALVAKMAGARAKPLQEMTAAEAREMVAAMHVEATSRPEMARVKDLKVRVTGGVVPVRLLVPCDDPDGVIVWYHGGGWVLGNIDETDQVGRHLAEQTGCAVVVVGYRLAPEYRFPTAVDDSYDALCWADDRLEEIAGRRVPLLVGGDSAGGNLSAVVALKARDSKGPSIEMQILVYPVTDCDFETTSYRDPANAVFLTRESMIWFWEHYAPDAFGRLHPDASPLRSADTSNLPPAVVVTAEHDVLRDEGEIYATRMVKSGVEVQHRRFAGQMHGFFTMVDVLPGSSEGIAYVAGAVRTHLDALKGQAPAAL